MKCPYCGKPAKSDGGLRKHLTGTRPYGGHELAPDVAARVAAEAADGETVPASEFPAPAPTAAVRAVVDTGLGPQSPGEPAFRAQMRRHQSWYRSQVLGLPYGTGPSQNSTERYGNMLRPADAEAGANFLTPSIFRLAQERIASSAGVERFRCLHNMLSSQPMCFNIFGPLVDDLELATRLIGALLPGEVEEVLDVRIEHAPPEGRRALGDKTSFDAFVVYRRPDQGRGLLGIETKLTEPFSSKSYDTPRYRDITSGSPHVWKREHLNQLQDVRWNQLWRNHLLVEASRTAEGQEDGRLVVVYHADDPDCRTAIQGYRSLLTDPDRSLVLWPLDRLAATWNGLLGEGTEASWLQELERRYVDLSGESSPDRWPLLETEARGERSGADDRAPGGAPVQGRQRRVGDPGASPGARQPPSGGH